MQKKIIKDQLDGGSYLEVILRLYAGRGDESNAHFIIRDSYVT